MANKPVALILWSYWNLEAEFGRKEKPENRRKDLESRETESLTKTRWMTQTFTTLLLVLYLSASILEIYFLFIEWKLRNVSW